MSDDPGELAAFLQGIKDSSLGGNIKAAEEHSIPPLAGVRGFSIVH